MMNKVTESGFLLLFCFSLLKIPIILCVQYPPPPPTFFPWKLHSLLHPYGCHEHSHIWTRTYPVASEPFLTKCGLGIMSTLVQSI